MGTTAGSADTVDTTPGGTGTVNYTAGATDTVDTTAGGAGTVDVALLQDRETSTSSAVLTALKTFKLHSSSIISSCPSDVIHDTATATSIRLADLTDNSDTF